MATNLKVCTVDDALKAKLKAFRLRKEKNNAAIVMKIDGKAMTIIEDTSFDEEDLTDCSVDDLVQELPTHLPRYVAYSYCYKHDDGRVSYPLCFFFVSPEGVKPELQMMYAGSKLSLVNEMNFTKVFEFRSVEDLTEEALITKLKFFR
ncbi:glia maturation factor beta-like [Halichondria panicea]|uniref:glia maturation factor beta-like n=1 Tax=Halichondria panicea TaxID=6063 RepID=UPI00312BB0FA